MLIDVDLVFNQIPSYDLLQVCALGAEIRQSVHHVLY